MLEGSTLRADGVAGQNTAKSQTHLLTSLVAIIGLKSFVKFYLRWCGFITVMSLSVH